MSGPSGRAAALRTARGIAVLTTAGVLFVAACSALVPPRRGLEGLVLPVALLGLVSPAIGYRLYDVERRRAAAAETPERRFAGFVRANVMAFGVTEGAGLAGIASAALSGSWPPMVGVLTHVLLAGALWPTAERLDAFLASADATNA